MSVQVRDLAVEFAYRFGGAPTVSRAPGRVNLIGEHTDYNDGFVMPAALEFSTLTAVSPRPDRRLRVYSMIMDETREFDLDAPPQGPSGDWSDYVIGVALMLEIGGFTLSGADLVIWSDVPIGAGLSSSAALEVSVAHALLTQSDLPFDPIKIAQICQRAENDFVGMRCGVMDQYIACCGVAGHALLIDCRSLDLAPCRHCAQLTASHRQQRGPPSACRRRIQFAARGLRGRGEAAQPLSRADQGAARRDS